MSNGYSRKSKLLLIVAVISILLILALPVTAAANSAEPPSLIILINNPPDDLSITLESSENQPKASVRKVAWEGYYIFYSRDMQGDGEYTFSVNTNGESFKCTIDEPLRYYNNVYTLNLSNGRLTPGEYPFRSVLLVSIRVLLTLLIEGIIFWLFRFRQRRSWLTFLVVNLVTQGVLNIWLGSGVSPVQGYLIIKLIFGEIFVFLAEIMAFMAFIREHKWSRILIYVLVANFISLVVGGYIITVLPV